MMKQIFGLASLKLAITALSLLCLARPAAADENQMDRVIDAGIQFFSGTEGKSLMGAKAYQLSFASEQGRGRFRGFVSAQFQYSSGSTILGSTTSTYKLFGASFVPGFNFFLFKDGTFQPFFGAAGAFGWNFFHASTPPSGADKYTQGFAYGYELSSGVDVRTRADGSAVRLRASLSSLSGTLAGQSGFDLTGFTFALGYIF